MEFSTSYPSLETVTAIQRSIDYISNSSMTSQTFSICSHHCSVGRLATRAQRYLMLEVSDAIVAIYVGQTSASEVDKNIHVLDRIKPLVYGYFNSDVVHFVDTVYTCGESMSSKV